MAAKYAVVDYHIEYNQLNLDILTALGKEGWIFAGDASSTSRSIFYRVSNNNAEAAQTVDKTPVITAAAEHENMRQKAYEVLGLRGTMLSYSKSLYLEHNPDNLVVFNSNVCVAGGKIWHGDIDITKSRAKLEAIAEAIGEKVYVLREMDARFDNEDSPKLEKAVFVTS